MKRLFPVPPPLVLAVLGWVFPLAAQTSPASFPGLDPDRRAAEYGRRLNGAPSWEDLAEASLWASGGEVPAAMMDSLRGAVSELRASLPPGEKERGDYVLTYMHRKFLTSYSALQTRVDTILSGGRFNCVSSAALYTVLAAAAGLEVRGVMTRDHAFVQVSAGGESFDVETTNPYGFDPGNRREFHDAFGTLTGFAYVPARNYRDRADISRGELISLIFTNRISELESRRNFRDAIPLAVNRAAFLAGRRDRADSPLFPDPEAHLMDRLLNYGASLVQGGREAEALQWAALAGARYPADPRWEEFAYTALNNLMVKQIRGGRLDEARESLRAGEGRINGENRGRLEAQLVDAELVKQSGEVKTVAAAEAGLEAVKKAEGRGLLPAARIEELRTFLLLKAGELRAAEAGWAAAIAYAEDLASRYGPNRRLEDQLRVFRSNRVADLHNAFAAAYNRRDYGEARRIAAEALGEFPGNRQLLQDRDLAEKAR
jgi:hypothetical protein